MKIETANLLVESTTALAAILALFQIVVSKKNFSTNSRRESIRYSSELVKNYLEMIIPLGNTVDEILDEIKFKEYDGPIELKYFSKKEIFDLGGEIKKHLLYSNLAINPTEETNVLLNSIDLMNALEAFSTPFIENVADEEVAFRSIGRSFCHSIEKIYCMYAFVRHDHEKKLNYFENTINLYRVWKERLREIGEALS